MIKVIEFNIEEEVFIAPDGWDYISAKQLVRIGYILGNPKLTEGERGMAALCVLMGVDVKPLTAKGVKRLKTIKQMNAHALHQVIYSEDGLGFLWGETNMTAYTLKQFWHRGLLYVGPPKHMLKLSTIELGMAMTFWDAYEQSGDMAYIDKLIALIYRPLNPFFWWKIFNYGADGDRRMPLNDFWHAKRARRFAKLKSGLKMALAIQFLGHLKSFQNKHTFVFKQPKQKPDSAEKPMKAKGNFNPMRWIEIAMNVAEKGTLGTYKDVERVDAGRFFAYLNMTMREQKKKEQEMKKLNRGKK